MRPNLAPLLKAFLAENLMSKTICTLAAACAGAILAALLAWLAVRVLALASEPKQGKISSPAHARAAIVAQLGNHRCTLDHACRAANAAHEQQLAALAKTHAAAVRRSEK